MYCTQATLKGLMPVEDIRLLSADDPVAEAPDWPLIAALAGQASSEIDASLRAAGISTPLVAPIPPLIVGLAARLVRCALYARRPSGDLPKAIHEDCRAARHTLADIAQGAIDIGAPQPPLAGASWSVRARSVTPLSMEGY